MRRNKTIQSVILDGNFIDDKLVALIDALAAKNIPKDPPEVPKKIKIKIFADTSTPSHNKRTSETVVEESESD
jgi:hypothetical protein